MGVKRENEIAGILARGLLRTQLPQLGNSREHELADAKATRLGSGVDAEQERDRVRRQGGAS
jgi:hypothetical protein